MDPGHGSRWQPEQTRCDESGSPVEGGADGYGDLVMQATRNAAFQLVPVTLLLFAGCSNWESFRLGQPLRPAPGTHPQQAESRSTPIELSGATAGAAAAAASSTTPTTPRKGKWWTKAARMVINPQYRNGRRQAKY